MKELTEEEIEQYFKDRAHNARVVECKGLIDYINENYNGVSRIIVSCESQSDDEGGSDYWAESIELYDAAGETVELKEEDQEDDECDTLLMDMARELSYTDWCEELPSKLIELPKLYTE